MNIKTTLEANHTLLILFSSDLYHDMVLDIVKELEGKNICYVTFNKTHQAIIEALQKKGIGTNTITFVDAISPVIKETPKQTKESYFVDTPGSLTDVAIIIEKVLKQNIDYIIFDSITTPLIYQNEEAVAQFVSLVANKISATKTKASFYAIQLKKREEFIQEISVFVDQVVEYH